MSQKIYAVLDTNVLVSALRSKDGIPALIYQMVRAGKVIPCYSDEMIEEYLGVLYRPRLKLVTHEVDLMIALQKKLGRRVQPVKSSISLPDESDRKFYDTAKTSDAILVSGNTKHFPSEPFIMTPREFWDEHGV